MHSFPLYALIKGQLLSLTSALCFTQLAQRHAFLFCCWRADLTPVFMKRSFLLSF